MSAARRQPSKSVLLAALLCAAANVTEGQSLSTASPAIAAASVASVRAARPNIETAPTWQVISGYEMRWYRNVDDILAKTPGVVTRDVDASTDGFDIWLKRYPPRFPGWGVEVGGYWATGIDTNLNLLNGHRANSSLTDYGLGFGFEYMPGETKHFSPFASINALYQWNRNKYTEFNSSNALALSETRTHGTWTGEYGIGGTYWLQPRLGLNLSASYSGQFKSSNADENFKLSTGLVLKLGGPSR